MYIQWEKLKDYVEIEKCIYIFLFFYISNEIKKIKVYVEREKLYIQLFTFQRRLLILSQERKICIYNFEI